MINYKYANFSHGRLYVCVSIHLLHSAQLIPVVRERTLNPFRPGALLFASNTDFSLQGWKRFFFLVFIPQPPSPVPCSVSCQDSEV